MRKIILIGLLGLFQWGQGQSVWTKTFEYNSELGTFTDVFPTSDGNFVTFGRVNNGAIMYPLLIVKINLNGDEIWSKIYPDMGTASDGIELQNGDLVFAGSVYDSSFGTDQIILKTDQTGEEVWTKVIDYENSSAKLDGITELSDGSILACGDSSGQLNVINMQADGTIIWNNTYENGRGYDIVPAWDGGGVIVGERIGISNFWNIQENGADYVTLTLPGGGDWAGNGTTEKSWSVALTDDGNYITTGLRLPDTSNQYNKHDVGMYKVDNTGNILWQTAFGKSWASHDEGKAVIQTSDGGYIIAGRTKPDNIADNRLWLIKTDTEGNLEWENESFSMSQGNGIVEASDGCLGVKTGSGALALALGSVEQAGENHRAGPKNGRVKAA